jgi:hypothetical protein
VITGVVDNVYSKSEGVLFLIIIGNNMIGILKRRGGLLKILFRKKYKANTGI